MIDFPISRAQCFARIFAAPMAELSHRALRELIEGFNPAQAGGDPPPKRPSGGPSGDTVLTGIKNDSFTESAIEGFEGHFEGHIEHFTEMISAPALLAGGPFEKWYLDAGPCPERVVYQLVGSDPAQLSAAAALLARRECAGIDINMGCAAPAIARTGAGIAWMEDIEKAGRLAAALRKAVGKRLSFKLRLGPKKPAQKAAGISAISAGEGPEPPAEAPDLPGFGYLLQFCRRLENEGADLIILHPRRGDEKFKRPPRWDYVDALRKELSIPVAGNGDINSAEELARRAGEGPVMAGRLAVREPWIFAALGKGGEAVPPKLEETALVFLDLLARYQPPEFHLSRARRFFRYYCDNFTWAEYLRNKINREETLSGIAAVIRRYCRENPSKVFLQE